MIVRKTITTAILVSTVFLPFTVLAQVPDSVISGLSQLPAIKSTINAAGMLLDKVPTVPTSDIKLNAKETGISVFGYNIGISWNQIALDISKLVVNQIVNSTVNWMQNGFDDGGPAYVADSKSYFGNLANGVLGDELNKLSKGVLCTPFQAKITLALRSANVGGDYSPQCKLTGIVQNYTGFMNNFQEGGWGAFFAITQNSANNPYGAFADAQLTIDNKVATEVNSATQEISWGSGFKSQKSCKKTNTSRDDAQKWMDAHPNDSSLPPGYNPQADFGACLEYGDVMTPGATLKSHLDISLPANTFLGQVVSADTFDKLLTALGNGLLQRFVFKNGLLGKGSSSSNSGSSGTTSTGDQTLTCSPNVDTATANDTEVTWMISNSFNANVMADYTWSGKGGLDTQTGVLATTTYTTAGTYTASIIASTTKLDDLGVAIPNSHQERTIPCAKGVVVSQYRPLAVSCSAAGPTLSAFWNDEAVQYPTVNGVNWVANITGGSGTFTGIQWGGDQDFIPGTNGDANRIWPDRFNAPNNSDKTTTSGTTINILHTIDLKPVWGRPTPEVASSETIVQTKDSTGATLTKITLTRPYYKDGNNTQVMRANITVTDKDLSLQTVMVDCAPSYTLIDK